MSKRILDLCDESTDLFALSTEEDRDAMKNLLSWPLRSGSDAIIKSPGFSWERFGPNGDKLIEYQAGYKYDEHHNSNVKCCSVDPQCLGGAPWLATLQYGRVADALKMLDSNLEFTRKVVEFSASAGYALAFYYTPLFMPVVQHMIGSSKHVQSLYAILGITFENVEERLDTATKPAQGAFFATLECKEPGKGLFSLTRGAWQVKAMCILHLDVPEPQAIAWLESLPDNDAYYAYSMTMPHYNHGARIEAYQACWIALAHEKMGLYEGALRFANLEVEIDQLRAGNPSSKWPQVIALACKGRVLAKIARHDEALLAFQAAIAASKESYSMMAAFAYRELANYADGGDTSVQAGKDLEAKLVTFEGRMTRGEFDRLTIAP